MEKRGGQQSGGQGGGMILLASNAEDAVKRTGEKQREKRTN